MSTSTITPVPPPPDGSACFTDEPSYTTQKSDIVELWLSQMSPPQRGDTVPQDEDTESCSSSADDNDGRVIMAFGDLIIADDQGSIGPSRRSLVGGAAIECGGLDFITAVEDEVSSSSDDEEEDVMLQSALLESMASAKQEQHQRSLEKGDINDPGVAVLTLNWADIELDEDESEIEISTQCSKQPYTVSNHSLDFGETDVLDCPWTAWYDPPKGRCARLGIASDTYEKKLFEMGLIQCPEDFWTVHEMVDWNNMPCGSMVSFSRIGSKPFWEDPMHHNGGRWIIRGFPKSRSENLFTKVALSLFLGHFPDSQEFTCVTLQVKEKRRSNAIQLWTRTLDYDHVDEMHEHICCLVDGWDSDAEEQPVRRSRGKKSNRSSAPRRLHFEFCPNADSIERNAVKLGDTSAIDSTVRRTRRPRKTAEISMASRCHEVSEMYTQGHSRKKGGKNLTKASRRSGGRQSKPDWADSLAQLGYGKCRFRQCHVKDVGSECLLSSTPKAVPSVGDVTPEKSIWDSESLIRSMDADKRYVSSSGSTSVRDSSSRSHKRKLHEESWRSGPSQTDNPDLCKGSEDDQIGEDSRRRRSSQACPFLGTCDLESLDNDEEPIFVEFDPKLIGLDSGKPNDYEGFVEDCGWGHSTSGGGWAPLYANSHFMSIAPSTGTFDSHGCWYPPTTHEASPIDTDVSSGTIFPAIPSTSSKSTDELSAFLPAPSGRDPQVLVSRTSADIAQEKLRCHSGCSIVDDCSILDEPYIDENASGRRLSQLAYSDQGEWQYWGNSVEVWRPECGGYYSQATDPAYMMTYPYCQQEFYGYSDDLQHSMYYVSQHSSEISRLADSVANQTKP